MHLAAPISLAHSAIPLPLTYFGKRQTGLFIGLNPFIQKASVCGWLHWGRRGVSRMGWGSSLAERGGVGWRGGKGTKKRREEGELGGVSRSCSPRLSKLTFQETTLNLYPFAVQTCSQTRKSNQVQPVDTGMDYPTEFNPLFCGSTSQLIISLHSIRLDMCYI